jgi:Tfp pilus assembly protein PilO
MNFKDPKNQILVFVVILFLAAGYIWYTRIYSSYNTKITAKKSQLEKELSDLHSVQQKAATLDELQKEIDDLQIKYKKVELLLPERKEDESFLSQIHAAAQLTGSTVVDITPMGTQAGDFYETNSYTVAVESSYNGLGKFFAKVANFPFIVNVSDLELKTTGSPIGGLGQPQKNPNETLIATFKMSTYNVKQGASG